MTPSPEAPDAGLVLVREFDAPRDLVFRAWTEPERMKRWFGPAGFTTPHCTLDARPGGAWHLCMRSPEGQDFWCGGVYREVSPERIVMTDHFADADGNRVPPAHYGMSADFPEETLITATFEEKDGRTTLRLEHTIPAALAETSGAIEGWSQSLDKLDAALAAA